MLAANVDPSTDAVIDPAASAGQDYHALVIQIVFILCLRLSLMWLMAASAAVVEATLSHLRELGPLMCAPLLPPQLAIPTTMTKTL